MKSTLSFLVTIFCFSIQAQAPSWAWAHSEGGSANDYPGGTLNYGGPSIATDISGNSFVTGTFNGTATFGSFTVTGLSGTNIFVAKYNNAGNCLWVKNFGGGVVDTYGNEGYSIDVDNAGNCYITGLYRELSGTTVSVGTQTLMGTGARQIFIAKFDGNGNALWARQAGGTTTANNYGKSIAVDASGNSFITCYLGTSGVTFGELAPLPGAGGCVVMFNTGGTALWATHIGQSTDPIAIDTDNLGNVFVTGYLQGTGTFVTTPATTITSIGMRDVFVSKLNGSGVYQWVKHFGGSAPGPSNPTAYGKGISTDLSGNIFITGEFSARLVIGTSTLSSGSSSGTEAYAMKLDPAGSPVWVMQTNNSSTSSSSNAGGIGIKASASGDCFINGSFSSSLSGTISMGGINFPNQGNNTLYVLKINNSGTAVWGQFSSGSGHSIMPGGLSIDGGNNVYVTGMNQGSATLGTHTISSAGGMDMMIAKLGEALIEPTSINDHMNENGLKVFPNPSGSEVYFDLTETQGQPMELILYNSLGQEVKRQVCFAGEKNILNREQLNAGIYFYQLNDGKQVRHDGSMVLR